MAFPMNTPNKTSFILILNIDTKAAVDHDPIIGSSTPTNIIKHIILAAYSFFTLTSIFLYDFLYILLHLLLIHS